MATITWQDLTAFEQNALERAYRSGYYIRVNSAVANALILHELATPDGGRAPVGIRITDKGRALYDNRNAQPEAPAPVADTVRYSVISKSRITGSQWEAPIEGEHENLTRAEADYIYQQQRYHPHYMWKIVPQLDGLTDFLAALATYVQFSVMGATKYNRYTADICDYHAAWFLGFAERRQQAGDDAQYRAALRRVQYFQNGAALARGTGRLVRETKAGSAWAVVPAPVAALDITELDPDYDNDVAFEDEHAREFESGRLQI